LLPVCHDASVAKPRVNIGATTSRFVGRIDRDAAKAYALATNDPNPVYEEGRSVPPLFTVALILPTLHAGIQGSLDPGAIADVRGGVHGEHDVYFHHPLAPGASVSWQGETSGAIQTPAGVLVPQKIVISDEAGPAVTHYWSTLYIGGRIAEPVLGEALAEHDLPESAKARLVGVETFDVAGDQTFRYAGASTDHALFHIDDEAARRAGFPGKFLQGLCTFAMCSGAVVKHAAAGNPDRLGRLAGRFSSPLFPRNQLTVEVYDIGAGTDGRYLFGFEATSAGKSIVKHGRAEFLPE
jgi:acyl dehydratase